MGLVCIVTESPPNELSSLRIHPPAYHSKKPLWRRISHCLRCAQVCRQGAEECARMVMMNFKSIFIAVVRSKKPGTTVPGFCSVQYPYGRSTLELFPLWGVGEKQRFSIFVFSEFLDNLLAFGRYQPGYEVVGSFCIYIGEFSWVYGN